MQTEDHARALFAYTLPDLPAHVLEARIAHRMQRRIVFNREEPPEFVAVIHEAALRMPVGDRKTRLDQLIHLLDLSESPSITVCVLPFDVDEFAGTGWSMLYLGYPVSRLDTALIDTPNGGIFMDAEAQLRRHRVLFARSRALSLGPQESRDFIRRMAQEL